MSDRRSFFKTSAGLAGAAVTAAAASAQETRTNLAGVGGYDYRLPALRPGMRLLFQGDSITDMNWGRNQSDRNHYLGHSYVFLIACRLGVDMPNAKLEFLNRGISGNTVAQLKERWQKDAIDMKPDLLSILIGVNDVGRKTPVDKWHPDYRFILDASRKANPDLQLVLLDPFVLKCGRFAKDDEGWKTWRGAIEEQIPIVAQLAKEYNAIHIKTQEVFDAAAAATDPANWIWDGVHPLPAGHELIARNWLQAVSAG